MSSSNVNEFSQEKGSSPNLFLFSSSYQLLCVWGYIAPMHSKILKSPRQGITEEPVHTKHCCCSTCDLMHRNASWVYAQQSPVESNDLNDVAFFLWNYKDITGEVINGQSDVSHWHVKRSRNLSSKDNCCSWQAPCSMDVLQLRWRLLKEAGW